MFRLLIMSSLVTVVLFTTAHLLFPLPDQIHYSTIITDRRGETMHVFLSRDEKWRMKTQLNEISPLLRKTIIRKEDRYFYYHKGVNPFAIARAFVNNLFHFKRTSGASTITMQVARALERKPRTYGNKIIEIFRAFQLEIKYNKNEILQMYCNLLPYGGNIEGVKAASLLYFQKNPDHLSLAEIMALSIIPNRPISLVPGKHNERIRLERDKWLKYFAATAVFSEKEIEDALSEPFNAVRHQVPRLAPHLSIRLRNSPTDLVQSTLDLRMQSQVETIVTDYSRALKARNISNASVVVIDNQLHQVIAYVGSSNFYDTINSGQVDGVIATRQPGSTLKPLLYALSIDQGLLTPKSVITDVPVSYAGYAPENYDRQFSGYVSMDRALELSLNIPAVKSLSALGTRKLIDALLLCNFNQVRKDEKKLGLSTVLGGCGTNLLELTGMFSAFANNGVYFRPTLVNIGTKPAPQRLVSEASAFMINEVLSKVSRPDFPINWQSTGHMPKIAWKTGTSYGRRDGWSIGYNKRFTVGVWTGNFSGEGSAALSGAEIATPLLFKIFNTIDYDSDEAWFDQPADCDLRIVCAKTGLSPGDHCTDLISDYFIPGISSTSACQHLKEYFVSADEHWSYCRTCLPPNGYKTKLYPAISADMQQWMNERGVVYKRPPAHNPACEQVFRDSKPTIVSPSAGSEYLVGKTDPEPLQLQARAGEDVNTLFWYIDNRFYKAAPAGAAVFFTPQAGPVKISCTDDKGRNRDIWITVRQLDF